MRFESNPEEKLYGMGQYQQPYLNIKGCELELAQRNSQASVPFLLSSLGYGFLWNNPGIGRVTFGKNLTVWQAVSTKLLDYWICAGDSPAEIEGGLCESCRNRFHDALIMPWVFGSANLDTRPRRNC